MNPYTIEPAGSGKIPQATNKKPLTMNELIDEVSFSESDFYRSYAPYGTNPDPVARAKTLKIYREMTEDDQIKACLEIRKQARLSTPWRIMSAQEGNALADTLADFITHVLNRMNGAFEDDLYQMYSAIEFGFSISELVYEIIETGPFAGKIGLRDIKTREPYNYDFKIDAHGNLLGIIYTGPGLGVMGQAMTPSGDATMGTLANPFPIDKFVIYSYNMQFSNWYGKSDLLAAFTPWITKKHVMKFWAIWLERYASPFIWAQYKRDAGLKKEVLETLDSMLRNLSARQGIRVSDAIDINPVQFSTAGGDAYEKAVEAHNRYISHAIMCPNLIGITGSQGSGGSGGSYSLGRKQFDAFVWILEKMGRDTSEVLVGDQIIKRLVDLNFPNVDPDLIPKFKFESVEEESIEARARIISILAEKGFISAEEEWIRDFLTIPKKDPGIVLPPARSVNPGWPNNASTSREGFRQSQQIKVASKVLKKYAKREVTRFEKKMQVSTFAANLDDGQEEFQEALTEPIIEIRDRLIDQVTRKKIVENGDPKAVDSLVVNSGTVKDVLRRWLFKFHLDAKLGALEELGRGGVEIEITRSFADIDAPFEPWAPLPPLEAIDFFNRKVKAKIVNKNGEKTLVELATRAEIPYYDAKAFAIAGIVRDDILSGAKQVMLNGIKRQDEAGAIKDLKDMFNKYIQQGVAIDDELMEPSRVNTIVRTNMVEAINEGRRAMYEDPAVKGFVEFWQYTAIMDDHTTDYCRCMDEKIFRMEDMPMLVPPAHYNCRSFSVPVTQFEIDDMKKDGEGVEISEPCQDRAAGFSRN